MEQYKISNYTVEADIKKTLAWYKSYEGWSCDCGYCRNFLKTAKQGRLPREVTEILSALGLPPEKPTYVCELCPKGKNHLYDFSWRIVGNILKEPSQKEPESIICGHESYPHGAPGFPEPHFDIMFFTEIPYILEEPDDKPI
ncbi:MAG: hypothetical protein LUD81_03140 [Clostridiales bacterium]|nr:hypothetical protein [Clostridiales bacterium]